MNQRRRFQFLRGHHLFILLLVCRAAPALAGDMIAGAAGKTGELQVKLTQRAPLSSQVAQRIASKVTSTDYDISKETFDVYVPAEAGADGAYGLMIAMNFNAAGKPPAAWTAVLDKHHLIWIGAENAGDGLPFPRRIGMMLDAVYNAEGTWKIDPNRVYSFISSADPPACGAPLYFPDVFVGSVDCHLMQWFHSVPNTVAKELGPWRYGTLPKIKPPYLDLAKSRRYYIVDRLEEFHVGAQTPNADVMKGGYIKDGFKNVTLGGATTNITMKYADCAAGWFEPAVAYVDVAPETPALAMAAMPQSASTDAAAAQTPPAPEKQDGGRRRGRGRNGSASAAPPPTQTDPPPAKVDATPPPPPTPPPATVPDDPAAKAAKALNLAKSYISAERFETARQRLQQIVQTYPDTPSAKEAKTLLDQIKDK